MKGSFTSRSVAAASLRDGWQKHHLRIGGFSDVTVSCFIEGELPMFRSLTALTRFTAVACALTLAATAFAAMPAAAQQAPAAKKAASTPLPKAGPGEKVCRHKFPDGTPQAWVCKSAEPCCAWDEIKYVKCGSTTFKCL
jgi:hypothetical protein